MLRWTLLAMVSAMVGVSCASGGKKAAEPAKPVEAATEAAKEVKKEAKAAAKAAVAGKVECSSGTDVRTIEVQAKDGGCETVYTKFGNSETVSNAVNGTEYCESTVDKIKGNLENAGFACK